jgi:catechol 2,3-dioxygenase-like lactoylglutathione lyase family enzyme
MPLGPIEAIRISVTDHDAARRFYREALGLVELSAAPEWAMYDTGQAKLLVEQIDANDDEAGDLVGRFVGVSFTVGDIDAVCAELRARGVTFLGPPSVQPWGGTLAHCTDPDHNVLTLVQYPRERD